jgi:hypothetical protein
MYPKIFLKIFYTESHDIKMWQYILCKKISLDTFTTYILLYSKDGDITPIAI